MPNRTKAKIKSLTARIKAYEALSVDKRSACKKPGSRKK